RQGKEPGPGRGALAERGEGIATVLDDPRQVRHRFDVVDDRRLAVEADRSREVRRLDPREAATTLEALEQRRLLAPDVGARAGVDDEVDRELRAEDLVTDRPVLVGLVAGGDEPLVAERELAPAEDERLARADRVRGDERPFDHLVWVTLDEQMILE